MAALPDADAYRPGRADCQGPLRVALLASARRRAPGGRRAALRALCGAGGRRGALLDRRGGLEEQSRSRWR
eukprot:13610862-Alexandrium_andersonii.AAC.1